MDLRSFSTGAFSIISNFFHWISHQRIFSTKFNDHFFKKKFILSNCVLCVYVCLDLFSEKHICFPRRRRKKRFYIANAYKNYIKRKRAKNNEQKKKFVCHCVYWLREWKKKKKMGQIKSRNQIYRQKKNWNFCFKQQQERHQ